MPFEGSLDLKVWQLLEGYHGCPSLTMVLDWGFWNVYMEKDWENKMGWQSKYEGYNQSKRRKNTFLTQSWRRNETKWHIWELKELWYSRLLCRHSWGGKKIYDFQRKLKRKIIDDTERWAYKTTIGDPGTGAVVDNIDYRICQLTEHRMMMGKLCKCWLWTIGDQKYCGMNIKLTKVTGYNFLNICC